MRRSSAARLYSCEYCYYARLEESQPRFDLHIVNVD